MAQASPELDREDGSTEAPQQEEPDENKPEEEEPEEAPQPERGASVRLRAAQNALPTEVEPAVVEEITLQARNAFQEAGEEFDEDAVGQVLAEPPEKPRFPFFMLFLALINDALDVVGALVGIGPLVTIPFQIMSSIIFFFYFWGTGKWWKKYIVGWIWKRLILVTGVESVPYVGEIVPMNTIFVLTVHYKETKIVKMYERLLEDLKEAGVAA